MEGTEANLRRASLVLAALALFATAAAGCSRERGKPGDPGPASSTAGGLSAGDGGGAFGALCTHDPECASGVCFTGRQVSYCSLHCTKDADCPSPPSAGVCSKRGFCKNK